MDARGSHDPEWALVGRDDELGLLERFVGAVSPQEAGERSGVLVVSGDPGIGKTAVLDAVERRAAARGTWVLRATGVESEVDIGFAALSQLLGPAGSLVPRLPPAERHVLEAALGHSDRVPGVTAPVAGAVIALLRLLGDDARGIVRPPCAVLALVDDLQWIDRASADVLGEVARALDPRRTRMVVTQRTGARTYFDTTGHGRLSLEPLPDDAADSLLRGRHPVLGEGARRRVVALAGGNPLAILELPTQLDEVARTDAASSVGLPNHIALTERLQNVFGSRITQLGRETRHVLLMAALDQAERATPLPDVAEGLRILAPAERAHLVDFDRRTGRVEFRHPLVRATVVSLSTSQERRRAHRALAAWSGADEDLAAWHLAAATVRPDEHVAGLLESAAARARTRGDAAGAVRGLVRAAQLSPVPSERARRLARAAFQGADVEGDLARATSLLGQARSADPRSLETLQAAVATAYVLLNGSGDTHTAHQVLMGALEAARDAGPPDPVVHAEALQTLAEVCVYAADPLLWESFETALEEAPLPDPAVLDLWVRLVVDPARTAHAAMSDLDRALDGLRTETDPATIQRIATAGVFVDRVEPVRDSLTGLLAGARRGEAIPAGIVASMLLALTDFNTGRWQRATDTVEDGLRLADAHGFTLLSWPLRYTEAMVAAATGDHERVRRITDQMHSWGVPRRVGTVQHYAYRATMLDALARGEYEEAYLAGCRVCPPGLLPRRHGHALWIAMDLVEAAVLAGHRDAAQAHVLAMEDADVGSLSPRLAFLVAGSRAMAADPLDEDLFARALSVPDASQWPFELARVHLAYGQRLRRARAVTPARVHLTAAHDLFTELGARPWSLRARDELSATSPARRSTPDGLRTLTTQEVRIASLAAKGHTNKQIADQLLISPRTVGAHLQHVFTKLDLTSRAGLHHALGEHPSGSS